MSKTQLTYNLPDELELFKSALKAKETGICPIEQIAIKELVLAINNYMLNPSTNTLLSMYKLLDKYKSALQS